MACSSMLPVMLVLSKRLANLLEASIAPYVAAFIGAKASTIWFPGILLVVVSIIAPTGSLSCASVKNHVKACYLLLESLGMTVFLKGSI